MKMDCVVLLLAFALFWKPSQSIQCYHCETKPNPLSKRPACEEFDGGNKFIIECPSSTMCYKRTTTLGLGDRFASSEERACAPQTFSGDQRKVKGKWIAVKDIYDVYDESCQEKAIFYDQPSKTVDCYCRGNLCNDASTKCLHFAVPVIVLVGLLLQLNLD